ncbi:MAG TPA: hypothetical protein VLQ45_24925 [Thermoanaerobaculia bacterium]|nr:hypothetical protein [Thermoanaerobaculia bacterium]
MTIELSATVEKELEHIAVTQQRDLGEVIEEALRQYVEANAITDLDPLAVSEAQLKLAGELRDITEWTID